MPLEVLGQPAQCFDCGTARGATHGPVLALARHGCMQKVDEQCDGDALKGKMLRLHEVQEGEAACNVAVTAKAARRRSTCWSGCNDSARMLRKRQREPTRLRMVLN